MKEVLDFLRSNKVFYLATIDGDYSPEKFLWSLLEAEITERDCRSLRYRLGQACFPVQKQ